MHYLAAHAHDKAPHHPAVQDLHTQLRKYRQFPSPNIIHMHFQRIVCRSCVCSADWSRSEVPSRAWLLSLLWQWNS